MHFWVIESKIENSNDNYAPVHLGGKFPHVYETREMARAIKRTMDNSGYYKFLNNKRVRYRVRKYVRVE